MPVDRIYAHPAVSEDGGRVALKRGPVVYCVEETDLGGEPQRLRLPASAELSPRYDASLLGGATERAYRVICSPGLVAWDAIRAAIAGSNPVTEHSALAALGP